MTSKHFHAWVKEQGIILKDWQSFLADKCLVDLEPHKQNADGKTFIMRLLWDFIDEHGNDFEF